MNPLQKLFEYGEKQLRTAVVEGEPWFVAKDVCDVLELNNVSQALSRLDDDEKGLISNDTPSGKQNLAHVNEYGLYALVLSSRKKEARNFKRWVTHDVIPSLRKTGQYSNVQPMDEKQSLIAAMKLSTMVAEETEELKKVTSQHSQMILALDQKVDQQITLDYGEQRRLQKAVSIKVYELESNPKARPKLFREIKDRFGVASYKDVKRKELQSAINYIENYIPRKVS